MQLPRPIQPAQGRDSSWQQAINALQRSLPRFVVGEVPAPQVPVGNFTPMRMTSAPTPGSVALYIAGLRIPNSGFSVQGEIVTVPTASITGDVVVDYRY